MTPEYNTIRAAKAAAIKIVMYQPMLPSGKTYWYMRCQCQQLAATMAGPMKMMKIKSLRQDLIVDIVL